MAVNATVSDELANKFAAEKETPYLRWVRDEGLDIISAHYVPNLRTVCSEPSHCLAEAMAAARGRRRIHQPRGVAHVGFCFGAA